MIVVVHHELITCEALPARICNRTTVVGRVAIVGWSVGVGDDRLDRAYQRQNRGDRLGDNPSQLADLRQSPVATPSSWGNVVRVRQGFVKWPIPEFPIQIARNRLGGRQLTPRIIKAMTSLYSTSVHMRLDWLAKLTTLEDFHRLHSASATRALVAHLVYSSGRLASTSRIIRSSSS